MSVLELPSEMIQAGRVSKAYGTAGEVIIRCNGIMPEEGSIYFLEFDNFMVPFAVEYAKSKGSDGAIVKFESVNDLSHAEELVGKNLSVSADSVEDDNEELDENAGMEALVGFTLIDAEGNTIGEITEFLDYPSNPCLQVEGRITVPIHPNLILGFDAKRKELQIEIPQGLLEL